MNKSFTLIEILVVIVVIGIISSFIIIGLSSVSDKANIAKGQAFSNSLRNSLLMNIISEWKFDGNANDSWSTNNGTVSGATLISSNCVKGSCYSFDGVDDYISFSDLGIPINGPATVLGWFYFKDTAKTRGTTMRLYGTFLYQHRTNDYIYIGGSSDYFHWASELNSWYCLALTYLGNAYTAKLFINGRLENITIQSGSDIPAFSNQISYSSSAFNGLIDEVQVYNQVISTSQIQQNYYSGLNKLFANKGIADYSIRISQLKEVLTKNMDF